MEASPLKIREALRLVTHMYMSGLTAVEDDVHVPRGTAGKAQELSQVIHNAELALASHLSRAGALINAHQIFKETRS